MSQTLHLSLLGPPLITVNNHPLAVDRKKAIALLSYLAVTGQTQARNSLASLFWPESPRARANLRQTLWILKKALGESWLKMDREQVQLQPGYYLDIAQLETAAAEAEAVLADKTRELDPTRLGEAADLYRNAFLSGFSLTDAPEFDSWQSWQSQLHEQKLGLALQLLIHAYRQRQEWRTAIQYGQRWVGLDPFHETAHYELMQLYIAAGDPAAAIRQYEQCQQILADELGVTPQGVIVSLYQTLRQKNVIPPSAPPTDFQPELLPHLPLDALPEPGPLPPGSRLSLRPNPHFVGRQDELSRLAKLLKIDHTVAVSPALVAATGLGGIGKTQLAVEFAYRYGRFFPGGVFWLNCAETAAVPNEIAQCGGPEALNLAPDFDKWPLSRQVKEVQETWQDPISRLLIFDNCEDEAILDKWRPALGHCRILVTSRRTHWHPALAVAPLALETLARAESIKLLGQLAPHLSPPQANQIAAVLGDLPLALSLAGCFLARYRSVSPLEYLKQLRQNDLLAHPSLTGRHNTYSPTKHEQHVARSFALSYERLDPQNKIDELALALLDRVACFAPGEPIPKDILARSLKNHHPEIAEDALLVEDALWRLFELGLLDEKAADSVWLHRLLAAFVQNINRDETAQTAVEEAILAFIQQKAAETEHLVRRPQLENHLRIITDTALQRQDELAADLSYWVGYYWRAVGDFEAARSYLEQALAIRKKRLSLEDPKTAVCLSDLGDVLRRLEQYEQAQTYLERALAICQETFGPNHLETAQCLTHLSGLFWALEEYAKARTLTEQALQIRQNRLGKDHPDTIICLSQLGVLLQEMGELDEALVQTEAVLALRKTTLGSQHPAVARSLDNLGYVLQKMGQQEKALTHHQHASHIFQKALGLAHPETALNFSNVGIILIRLKKLEEARPYLDKALEIRQNVFGPNHTETAKSLFNSGYLLQQLDDLAGAKDCFEKSLNIMLRKLGANHPHTQTVRNQLDKLN